jgi:hypothetical protein
MSTAHIITVTTTALLFPLLLSTSAAALEVPEPQVVSISSSGVGTSIPYGHMGRPGWVTT